MKHLKLFFALFAMLALGVGNAWGAEVTVTKTTNTLVSELSWTVSSGSCAGCYTEFDLDNAITISTTGTPNCGSVWGTTTNDWRLYQNQNGNVIVSAKTGYELVSIKFTYSLSNSGTLKDGSTTVTTKTVVNCSGLTTKTLTVGNTGTKTNGQVKITEFSVTYTQTSADSGTEEPVLSVSPENITWKGIAASAEKSEEITVTLSNIEAVIAELSGDNPTAFSIDKELLEASGKIIVSKNTTTIGDYAAILTITDADTQTKTIALSMEVVADPEPTGTFAKFTGTIEEGDYVLVANETTDALKNTITDNRFDCGTVEVAEDKIVNPDKSVIWHIAANGTYWTMYNESTTKYAGGTTIKNQGALLDDVTDLAKWTIKVDGEGVYTFENYGRSQQTSDSGNKFLSRNSQNANAYWATYASGQKNPVLYKKSDGKQQAGLAYEEKEHTANVGEDFTEPTLTNPNSLTVTYSSSNTALATVNATTGEVSILAAGKVTITASSAADATYAAGSASYNITITDPSLAVAQLPFTYNSGKADIETTAGITQEGLGTDYSASTAPNSQLKFDGTGDWVVIRFDSEPEKLSYDIKNNSFSGGKFSVQESADGETYTDVAVHTTITDLQSEEYELNSASRYVKFIYTTKSSGNVGLGNISITKADHRQEAGIAWNPATVSLTVGDAFTPPTLSNPNYLTGITFTSDNEALATVTDAGVISLVSGKKGTATITATFADGHADYKPAEVTCTITVNPKTENVVILAQYAGQWYAMKAQYVTGKTSHLAPLPVTYFDGKLYNVNEADKALIEWERAMVDGKATFSNNSKYLTGKSGDTDLTLGATACEWTISGDSYLIDSRTFLYNAENNWFRNFGTSNAGDKNYSDMPVVTAPVYVTGDIVYTRTVTPGHYGTICIPYASSSYSGAEFYEVSWLQKNGETPVNLYLDQLGADAQLEAGKPYIFRATGTELTVTCTGDAVGAPIPGEKGLTGSFVAIPADGVLTGNYVVAQNKFWIATETAYADENRAYIDASVVPTSEQAKLPGRRRVSLGAAGENAETGIDNIITTDTPVKVIENGQLIIIRNGEKFNAQGQKL